MRGVHSLFRSGFFTILDNVLTVVELAGCEKQIGWPNPHPEGLLEGAGRGVRNTQWRICRGTLAVITAVREMCRDWRRAFRENLSNQNVLTVTVFCLFISAIQVVIIPMVPMTDWLDLTIHYNLHRVPHGASRKKSRHIAFLFGMLVSGLANLQKLPRTLRSMEILSFSDFQNSSCHRIWHSCTFIS
jgi:hypothetical protein